MGSESAQQDRGPALVPVWPWGAQLYDTLLNTKAKNNVYVHVSLRSIFVGGWSRGQPAEKVVP